MYVKKHSRSPKKPYKSVKRSVKRTSTKKPTIVKLIKKEITKMAEHKLITFSKQAQLYAYGSTSWNGNNVIVLTPFSNFAYNFQGTGQGDRIGNSIRIVKVVINGFLYPAGYNAVTNSIPSPLEIRFLAVKSKDNPLIQLTNYSTSTGNLFQQGGGTIAPTANGNLFDMVRQVNTDCYVKGPSKIYKLGFSSYGVAGGAINYQYLANNDFKLNQRVSMDVTKFCPKVVKFNDNLASPETPAVQLLIFLTSALDFTYNSTGLQAYFDYEIDITYTDL